ncbi:Transposase and inactivated derivatives, TnpA family [Kluyvera cryocrescens]|uniref:Transposase and inactivated derivatives, TnpA family n=1 Tax=Kluyvera cryocrescens TaxID=580 RepID=A0A485A6D6_KLUCR|nr:Transposase and inactivated derivatives, TnpA family [Kluyvera cryocrescens]
MTLLASRLEEVNGMALAGDLPDVDISDKGVKITPLENSVPSGVSSFADLVYGILPHPKITEILEEVDSWTGFTRHFTHLKKNNVRPKDGRLLLTTILADGINLGLTKMAESCPGATKSSLEGIQAWYIRDETYSAALTELVNAQKARPLAAFWGDGTTSSSDGQNFRVGSHGRYAGQVNLKYGQEPGVQIYTHISDQYSPFYAKVISRVRDSTHVLDGLLYHESDLEITEHYTDTAGFTEHVFALMHLAGIRFCAEDPGIFMTSGLFIHGKAVRYPGLQSVISTTSLNIKDIEAHWDEVLRLATSIKQGTVTASLMMKKLGQLPKTERTRQSAERDWPHRGGHYLCWTGSEIPVCADAYRRGLNKGGGP